jgi:hypothetical protein
MFDLHAVSIFVTGTGESDTTTPFLQVVEHNLFLPSNLTEDLFEEKKTCENGSYSLIIQTYFLVVDY